MKTIHTPMRAGNMMHRPLSTAANIIDHELHSYSPPLQFVSQLMLTKSMPRQTITCIREPSTVQYNHLQEPAVLYCSVLYCTVL